MLTATQQLAKLQGDNPRLRFARQKELTCDGMIVLGVWDRNAGGFIPVVIQGHGGWDRMPLGYLEIDGKAVGIEPENWEEYHASDTAD